MALMNRFNKGGVKFDVNIEGFTFIDLKSLYEKTTKGEIFTVDGLYINKKSSFGDHPVAILVKDELLVDLPSHMTDTVKEMLQDPEVVNAIKSGQVGFTIDEYTSEKFKKTCYSVIWEDIA